MSRILFLLVLVAACGGSDDYFTEEELMDPEACQDCHPNHYREWSGSMHAYAAEDPVFLAMNQRGQEETGGELGDFCVQCHAPMALRLGLTTDGTNLADVPQFAKGVTCYFCHSVADVTDDHNNPLVLAADQVLRAGINDPVASPKHRAGFSSFLHAESEDSNAMCGACHDVTTPAGVHLEATFAEWQETIFADYSENGHPLSCAECHMPSRPGVVAEADDIDVPLRRVRDHSWPAIDVALTDFPEKDAQLAGIESQLAPSYQPRICVSPDMGGSVQLRLDNVAAGHMLPSGAAHDRRVWVEVHVFDASDVELFAAGVVPDGEDPVPSADLWEIRDQAFDGNGDPTLFFWDVRSVDNSWLLKPTVTLDPNDPRFDHSTWKYYTNLPFYPQIRRVTMAVRVRPLAYEIIDSLEASGHLENAASIRAAIPTFTPSGSVLEWRPELQDLGGCVNPP